jgi:hypothetical protein
MGKVVQVKASVNTVRLPPRSLPYLAGETTTLTDAEYSGLTSTQKNSLVVMQSGLPDPLRILNTDLPENSADSYRMAKQYVNSAIRALGTLSNYHSYRLVATNGVYPPRPVGIDPGQVVYVGPSQPTDWLEGDGWDDTAS